MSDLQAKVITILRKYARDAAVIDSATALSDIGVDALDLPMVFLDLEDAAGASLTCADEFEDFETVGDLVDRVALRIDEKRLKALQPRTPKPKRGWMSAGTGSR